MNVGIDVGYGYVKATGSNGSMPGSVCFPSIVGKASEFYYRPNGFEIPRDENDGFVMPVNGSKYFVGSLARKHCKFGHESIKHKDWPKTEQYRVLFLAGLSRYAVSGNHLSVVTGLPIEFFHDKAYRSELAQMLPAAASEAGIRLDRVNIIPQPYGTFFYVILDHNGAVTNNRYADQKVGIIDIGFFTTDIVLADKIDYIEQRSGMLEVGINTACNLIHREVSALYRRSLKTYEAEEALRKKQVRVFGEEKDVSKAAEGAIKEVAGIINAGVRDIWGRADDIDTILFTGGGATLLARELAGYFPESQSLLIDAPHLANAHGYWKYANRVFQNL